jgi:hypothetical protein
MYGITSVHRLCEEVQTHLGYRWFVGLNLEDKVRDHSTFSKSRHERSSESNLFQELFDEVAHFYRRYFSIYLPGYIEPPIGAKLPFKVAHEKSVFQQPVAILLLPYCCLRDH